MTAHAMVAMPDLLGQLGREVSSLAEEIERLQDTLSDVLMAVPVNSELMERAQSLDHVYQHMKQLELVLERAGDAAPAGLALPSEPLLRQVSLAGLADRLTGRVSAAADSGDFEAF